MVSQSELQVEVLGEPAFASPLRRATEVLPPVRAPGLAVDGSPVEGDSPLSLERSGARGRLFFNPAEACIGLVTCGGVCPGLNNVIRGAVLELHHRYGVPRVLGFRYGYEGLSASARPAMVLDPDVVRDVHRLGGTFLGTSRGAQSPEGMVDYLLSHRVDALIAIGGDGTLRGAHAIAAEARRRGARLAVAAVPKSIDNDVPFVDRTFGFETAVEAARQVIDVAHTEAISQRDGVALVKLMGREAGFLAATATCASTDVNVCLVPEVPCSLDGSKGLLRALADRLARREHAVVVVAEGCAATLLGAGSGERDSSGNARFSGKSDVGGWLKGQLAQGLRGLGVSASVKYFDPSYLVRGVPANAADSLLADKLGRDAVHAVMAGRTNVLVGLVRGEGVHLPLPALAGRLRRIDPAGPLWRRVVETTGQMV